jgi:hypothetical protein
MITKPKARTASRQRIVRAGKPGPSDQPIGPGPQDVVKPASSRPEGPGDRARRRRAVVQHQSRMFEAILGVDPTQVWAGLVKRDALAAKVTKSHSACAKSKQSSICGRRRPGPDQSAAACGSPPGWVCRRQSAASLFRNAIATSNAAFTNASSAANSASSRSLASSEAR